MPRATPISFPAIAVRGPKARRRRSPDPARSSRGRQWPNPAFPRDCRTSHRSRSDGGVPGAERLRGLRRRIRRWVRLRRRVHVPGRRRHQDTDDSDPDEGDADYGNAISGVEAHVVKREEYRWTRSRCSNGSVEAVQGVTQVLQVTQDDATQLLRAFKWNVNRVNDEWFGDEEDIRGKGWAGVLGPRPADRRAGWWTKPTPE